MSVIESITPNEDPEDKFDEFTINFDSSFGERTYESLLDDYMSVSEEELREIYRKAGEALGEL